MHSFYLLTSTEQIHTPNCSLLNLHPNDMNRLKIYSGKKRSIVMVVFVKVQNKTFVVMAFNCVQVI